MVQACGSSWITCSEWPDAPAISSVLHLDPNPIRIAEVQLLRISAQSDSRFDASRCELFLDDICIEAVDAKAQVIDPRRNAAVSWVQPEKPCTHSEIHSWWLNGENRHPEQALGRRGRGMPERVDCAHWKRYVLRPNA